MKVLVINAGSSSLKFTMFRMTHERMLAKGIVERIGLDKPLLRYTRYDGRTLCETVDVKSHDEALRIVCRKLVDDEVGVMASLAEVEAIGHRVVHGGEQFTESTLVTPEVKDIIRECIPLAPLHNPANLGGIEACERVFPGVPNVAVFDTAFHQTMPPESYLFAIPLEFYTEHQVRRYGFHGTSHKYVAHATADFLGKPYDSLRMITCHLGNGSSITAVDRGRVFETSMGMTPLMGLVMGTRCGDIDPGVVLHLAAQGRTLAEVDTLLNKKSGLLGLAGVGSSDMRDVLEAAAGANEQAEQAVRIFVHRLVFYIGAYYTLMGGADAVVFTAGIGENSDEIRARVIRRLAPLGCFLDEEKNRASGKAAIVSTPNSSLMAVAMPTNEELMIGRDTVRIMQP
ncbi:MAG: acetate kinase [Kiritimatiellaeota bacterium]|nr:acetate kinase [Kiritimatiellota bacterium]